MSKTAGLSRSFIDKPLSKSKSNKAQFTLNNNVSPLYRHPSKQEGSLLAGHLPTASASTPQINASIIRSSNHAPL
jgi:hypothetical protein